MRKLLTSLGLLAGVAGAGLVLNRSLGSTDEAPTANPLPACPDGVPNCYRASRAYGFPTDVVVQAADRAVRNHKSLLTGTPSQIRRNGLGLDVVYSIGPLKDDVKLVIEGDSLGSTVHIRSSSRVGRGDFGVNRRRAQALLNAIGAEAARSR